MGVSVRSNIDRSRLGKKVYMMLDVAVGGKLRGFCKYVRKRKRKKQKNGHNAWEINSTHTN